MIEGMKRENERDVREVEAKAAVCKVKRGRKGACSLVKAALILSMEGVMEGDTLIGYRTDR